MEWGKTKLLRHVLRGDVCDYGLTRPWRLGRRTEVSKIKIRDRALRITFKDQRSHAWWADVRPERQTDKQTHGQTNRQTKRQTDRQTHIQTHRQIDIHFFHRRMDGNSSFSEKKWKKTSQTTVYIYNNTLYKYMYNTPVVSWEGQKSKYITDRRTNRGDDPWGRFIANEKVRVEEGNKFLLVPLTVFWCVFETNSLHRSF